MSIRKYGRFWAVYDSAGVLVCIGLYKKGAGGQTGLCPNSRRAAGGPIRRAAWGAGSAY